ncbi:MAG: TraB/GumN family protein [Bacteroidota bacterium]
MKKEFVKRSNWVKNLILLVGVLVGTLILSNAKAQRLENVRLWEIKGKGTKVSYIYGKSHLLPKANFHLKERIVEAFDASEQIVLKLNMNDPNMQAKMIKNMAMKNRSTLDQFFIENQTLLDATKIFIRTSHNSG